MACDKAETIHDTCTTLNVLLHGRSVRAANIHLTGYCGEPACATQAVEGILYDRYRERIFTTNGIDRPIIDAEPICAVGFLNETDR